MERGECYVKNESFISGFGAWVDCGATEIRNVRGAGLERLEAEER